MISYTSFLVGDFEGPATGGSSSAVEAALEGEVPLVALSPLALTSPLDPLASAAAAALSALILAGSAMSPCAAVVAAAESEDMVTVIGTRRKG